MLHLRLHLAPALGLLEREVDDGGLEGFSWEYGALALTWIGKPIEL